MDLSDLVHGMKSKSQRQREIQHRQGQGESSSQRAQSASQAETNVISLNNSRHRRNTSSRQGGDRSDSSSSPNEEPLPEVVGSSSNSRSRLSCQLCSREFESKTQFDQHNLVFHRRSKVPVKPREAAFPCPDCGKAFTSPSKRNIHQSATHMGLRPYKCDICSKAFGYKGDLTKFCHEKHQSTHSGIKAYSCYICGAKFARNFYVKRHIETVHEKKQDSKR